MLNNNRIGFHYFPDTLHYTNQDLKFWLPILSKLKASTLVLQSTFDRAIPEQFITTLVNQKIEPIIHFKVPLAGIKEVEHIEPILSSYARWGVRSVIFYDRPNMRRSWSSSEWIQQELIKRFLDRFLPLAYQSLNLGLTPVLPPLEPGGNYWDTAFLRSVLESFEARKQTQLLEKLTLSAYAWSGEKSLNWGQGGPLAWPECQPYFTPQDSQDQCGFRIFEWYQSITQTAIQKTCPLILLGAGLQSDPDKSSGQSYFTSKHKDVCLAIGKLLVGEKAVNPDQPQEELLPIPNDVISCNFWLLSAAEDSAYKPQAWFQDKKTVLPVVKAWVEWILKNKETAPLSQPNKGTENSPAPVKENIQNNNFGQTATPVQSESKPSKESPEMNPNIVEQTVPHDYNPNKGDASVKAHPKINRPIQHYLLLPTYEWGISDWHLEVIRPFVKKYQPTIGFSLKEAVLASRVTVVGSSQTFPEDILDRLRAAGCAVERISGDGTTIATELAKR